MDVSCYRGTPKIVGAFIDALYQNPTLIFVVVAGLSGLAGVLWFKANNKPE